MEVEPEPEELKAILDNLKSPDAAVRAAAIFGLQRLSNSVTGDAEAEERSLTEQIEAESAATSRFLNRPDVAAALLSAIEDVSAKVRSTTALMLAHVRGPEAEDALIRHLLHDPHHQVRMMCVASLDWEERPRAAEAFIAALGDAEYQVVFPACIALGNLGDFRAIEPLHNMLNHPHWQVRYDACAALVKLNAVDGAVVAELEDLVTRPEAAEHDEMTQTVGEFEKEFPGYTPVPTTRELLAQARGMLP